MKFTCVCGYCVNTGSVSVEEVTYFQSGKRKGEIKSIKQVKKQIDPDKSRFIQVAIEKEFKFTTSDGWYNTEVELYACPECYTIKMVKL